MSTQAGGGTGAGAAAALAATGENPPAAPATGVEQPNSDATAQADSGQAASGGSAAAGSDPGSEGAAPAAADAPPPPDPRAVTLQLVIDQGVAQGLAVEALDSTQEEGAGDSARWADEALLWVALRAEQENETEKLRLAMAASLQDAEERRAGCVPLEEQDDGELMERFGSSVVLPQLQALPCGSQLLQAPLRSAVIKLLELERNSRFWYRRPGTVAYFERAASQCCEAVTAAAPSSSSSPATPGADSPGDGAKGDCAKGDGAKGDCASGKGKHPTEKEGNGGVKHPREEEEGDGGYPVSTKARRTETRAAATSSVAAGCEAGRCQAVAAAAGGGDCSAGPSPAVEALRSAIDTKVDEIEHAIYAMPSSSGEVPSIFAQQLGNGTAGGDEGGDDVQVMQLLSTAGRGRSGGARVVECIVLD